MLKREDRRDLGRLGLLVAVYGLAFAPVLHAVYGHGEAQPSSARPSARGWISHEHPAPHDESQPHSHDPSGKHGDEGTPAGHTHGVGSVEHLQAVALPSIALPRMQVIWLEAGTRHLGQERPRSGEPLRPTAMPQAP
ncbi:hypothetical protein JRI60_32455 [Archangium violaceum]|uniref:hypothetical protein n=1 Tax=Archangium violaceum TaxID=83451 RepID=UPI0019507FFB|nr:hypothetical protein [Archangium violaceum]QRN93856.1 hypothetical protein JRI60_32455 [Archangium violaceum]